MRNLTVTIEDETYRKIRARCAERDTCVSHVVQAFLHDLPSLKNVSQFPLPAAPAPRSRRTQAERIRDTETAIIELRSAQLR